MAMAAKHWTAADLATLPDDGNRYEIIDGELFVTPSPAWGHQNISGRLFLRLARYLEGRTMGHAMFAPADVDFSDDTVVEPDLFVVPLVDGREPARYADVRHLLLAIEILSPSTARRDRALKRRVYQREGVDEYWIVDADAQVVERWRPGDDRPEILSERLEWRPDDVAPALVIELAELFAR